MTNINPYTPPQLLKDSDPAPLAPRHDPLPSGALWRALGLVLASAGIFAVGGALVGVALGTVAPYRRKLST